MDSIQKNKFSIVIPAYKAEAFIQEVVEAREAELKSLGIDYELIVVIDGMSYATAQELAKINSNKLKVYHYKKNRGKGFALRFGMLRASGNYIGFIDAGKDLPEGNLNNLISTIKKTDADAVVASKWHPNSQLEYSLMRTIMSKAYNLFVKLLFRIDVSDTQVGLKIFRKELIDDVVPRLLVKRFAFDIEILTVSSRLGYKNIIECAVLLEEDSKSTVKFWDGVKAYWDTLAIFYRLYIRRYYDQPRGRQIDKKQREMHNLKLIKQ